MVNWARNWLVVAALVAAATAAENKLEPNAILRFEFPELPPTLMGMLSNQPAPAAMTVQLPENYSRTNEFGLVVFLAGGNGGRGTSVEPARGISGPRDYVCVNLPLFKRALDKQEKFGGGLVAMDDFATISQAYRTMLGKLFEAVPNIKPGRSALGGFSNGGHTTGVLLAGKDEFILEHFRSFFFIDGGFGLLAANTLQRTALKQCRFLLLCGDKPDGNAIRAAQLQLTRALGLMGKAANVDVTTVIMRGFEHKFPDAYRPVIGRWLKGEKLSEAEQVNIPSAAAK
jgi:hypothetical protein